MVDSMGGDDAIVQAARVSYGKGTSKVSQDRGLIRYLMRHRHTTPFEMVEFKFHCKMPIFVARLGEGGGVGGVGSFGGLGGGGLCCILIFGYKVVKLSVARYVVFQVFNG